MGQSRRPGPARAIEVAQVIEELIELAKQMRQAERLRGNLSLMRVAN
jgi:hypothetical protein